MGKIISLSGIDGAGKSTQAKLLSAYLKSKGKKVKTTQKLFGYFLLKPLIRLLRKQTKSPTAGPVTRNKKNNLMKLWFIPAFIDIWIGYLVEIQPLKNKYNYLIADRTYDDIWANLWYYGYQPEWAFKYLERFLPKTDIAFLFQIKPENGKKHSDDFPLQYFKDQARIYNRLATYRTFYKINANKGKKEIFRSISSKIT